MASFLHSCLRKSRFPEFNKEGWLFKKSKHRATSG